MWESVDVLKQPPSKWAVVAFVGGQIKIETPLHWHCNPNKRGDKLFMEAKDTVHVCGQLRYVEWKITKTSLL